MSKEKENEACRCPVCKHSTTGECVLKKDMEVDSKSVYCYCCVVLRVTPQCGCVHSEHDEHSGSVWPSGEQMYPPRKVEQVVIESN